MSQLEIGLKWLQQLVRALVFQGVQCVLIWKAKPEPLKRSLTWYSSLGSLNFANSSSVVVFDFVASNAVDASPWPPVVVSSAISSPLYGQSCCTQGSWDCVMSIHRFHRSISTSSTKHIYCMWHFICRNQSSKQNLAGDLCWETQLHMWYG